MKIANTTTATKKDITAILAQETSKSSKIKQLFEIGVTVKEIANYLNIRYNFAYNVISNYCNINDIEITKDSKISKKDEILSLFSQGKSNKEIAKLLQTNYNYVCKVLKEQASVTNN